MFEGEMGVGFRRTEERFLPWVKYPKRMKEYISIEAE